MIKFYSVKNFRSISEEVSIDFVAKKYKETKLNPLEDNILPLIGIYGPNGGGKSSIINSMGFLKLIIETINNPIEFNRLMSICQANKNSENLNKPIEWKIELISQNKNVYRYTLKANKNEIEYESLELLKNKNSILFFERNFSSISLNTKYFPNVKISSNNLWNSSGSLFSFLYNINQNEHIQDAFNELIKIFVIDITKIEPISFNPHLGYNVYNIDFNVLENYKKDFLEIFKEIDINITDYKIDETKNLWLTKKSQFGTFKLPFHLESEGTKRIIQLMSLFVLEIKNGSTFFIDEIDSKLHTKLLGYVLKLFRSNGNKKSQLIFTSHDMNTLDSEFLRKDEVYFAALNESYFTEMVCLSSFKDGIREKTSYSKKYLDGKLGFDPYISKSIKWLEDDNEKNE